MSIQSVDVILVNYNTKDLLRAALASLGRSEFRPRRVFAIDNGSADGSAEMVSTEFPEVELIALSENLGFARANNLAFERSDADAVFLLNSDAEVGPETIGGLVEEMETDPSIGAVGPILRGTDGRIQFEGARRDPSISGEFGNISHLNVRRPEGVFGRYMMSDWDHSSTRDVEVLSGAAMLLRREALAGRLFRDDFFMYGEDVELCERLRDAGWKVRYFAGTEVLHHGGAASKKARSRMRVAGVVSMAQLLARRRGPFYALGYLLMVPFAWPIGVIVKKVWPR